MIIWFGIIAPNIEDIALGIALPNSDDDCMAGKPLIAAANGFCICGTADCSAFAKFKDGSDGIADWGEDAPVFK